MDVMEIINFEEDTSQLKELDSETLEADLFGVTVFSYFLDRPAKLEIICK